MRRLVMSIPAACSIAACAPTAASAAVPIKATEPVADQIPKFQQAVSDRSCDEVVPLFTALSSRPTGTTPGAPAAPGECDNLAKDFFDAWTDWQVTGSRQLGTAALVSGEKDGTKEQIWNLDADGVYRYAYGISVITGTDIGRKFTGRKRAQAAANAMVVAIRKHDCKALVKVTLPEGPMYQSYSSDKKYCKAVFTGHLQKWLRASPKAKPVFEGGTGRVAFFYVKTKDSITTISFARWLFGKVRFGALDYVFNKGNV